MYGHQKWILTITIPETGCHGSMVTACNDTDSQYQATLKRDWKLVEEILETWSVRADLSCMNALSGCDRVLSQSLPTCQRYLLCKSASNKRSFDKSSAPTSTRYCSSGRIPLTPRMHVPSLHRARTFLVALLMV